MVEIILRFDEIPPDLLEYFEPVMDAGLPDTWPLSPEPFVGLHFATFPTEIPRRAILAGTSAKGVCAKCGAPWKRLVERSVAFTSGSGKAGNVPDGKYAGTAQATSGTYDIRMGPAVSSATVGWAPTCRCNCPDTIPATVLDPFSGSGTTGVVALQLGRRYVGVELSPAYVEMAERRIQREGAHQTSFDDMEVA